MPDIIKKKKKVRIYKVFFLLYFINISNYASSVSIIRHNILLIPKEKNVHISVDKILLKISPFCFQKD